MNVYSRQGRSATALDSLSLAHHMPWHGWTSFEKSLTCLVELIQVDSHSSGNEPFWGLEGVEWQECVF